MDAPKAHKVLIVGGGFGGVKAALELSKDPRFNVTLLTDRPYFRYYPRLYLTATGGRSSESSIALSDIIDGKPIKLEIGSAQKIDRDSKQVITDKGEKYHYDTLIMALGVVTNFFGIKGLEEFAYGIKSLEEISKLKAHIHDQLTATHQPDLNYIIIGGGPTGIELTGELPHYLKRVMKNHGIAHRAIHIDLVEAAPKLIPRLPSDTSRAVARHLRQLGIKLYLGKTVQAETADALMVDGKPITSHTVIWTAGVTNHPFFKANNFSLTDRGKVNTNTQLLAEPNIYVIGDNANTMYSGLAQTALYDAVFVANSLKRQADHKKPKSYRPKAPVSVIPVGPRYAAVVWGQLRFYGLLGYILRELADLKAFHDYEPWWKAGLEWLTEFGSEESCPTCLKAEQENF